MINLLFFLVLAKPNMTNLHFVHDGNRYGMGCDSDYVIWEAHFPINNIGGGPTWVKFGSDYIPIEQERRGMYRCWMKGVTPSAQNVTTGG